MKNYGVALKALRKKSNITQASLAEKLNVTYQTVSKWENGVNTPDISVIEQICDLFGITVDEFLRLSSGENTADTSADTNGGEEAVQPTGANDGVTASATCPRCGNVLFARFCTVCGYDSKRQSDNVDNSASVDSATKAVATNGGGVAVKRKRLSRGAIAAIIIAAVVAFALTLTGFVYGIMHVTGWGAKRYSTVRFGSGDGYALGSMDSITVANGDEFEIPKCEYKYTGYKFCGWQCGNKVYNVGDKVKPSGRDMMLVAKWEPIEYTVVYYYGTQSVQHKYKYDEVFNLPDALFSREGYDQTGWKYAGISYDLGYKVASLAKTDNATVKLEAKWTPIRYIMTVDLVLEYEITFDGKEYYGGGPVEIECVYGEEPLNTWERFDTVWSYCYTFLGYTVYDADGNLYEGDLRYINSDRNAKPHAVMNWGANRYDIHLTDERGYVVNIIECEGRNEYVLPLASEVFGENYKPGYRFKRWEVYSAIGEPDKFFEDGETVSCLQAWAGFYGGGYDERWCELRAEWEEIE